MGFYLKTSVQKDLKIIPLNSTKIYSDFLHLNNVSLLVVSFQERPKHKVRRWSFGKASHSDERDPDKRGEDFYSTAWSSHKGTPVRQSNGMSMYASVEEWAAVRIQTGFRGYLV